MIRAVIFDLGGVLLRTEDPRPRRRLEEELGLAPGGSEALVFNSEMGTRAQLGLITTEALWAWVQDTLGLDARGLARFRRAFWAGDRLDRSLVSTISGLRPRVQTALLSNASDALRRVVEDVHPIASAFDLIVGSAYEGVMKPDPEIFRRVLDRLSCVAEEALFVDDFAVNTSAASELGMRVIHYVPGLDVAEALTGLGVFAPGLGKPGDPR